MRQKFGISLRGMNVNLLSPFAPFMHRVQNHPFKCIYKAFTDFCEYACFTSIPKHLPDDSLGTDSSVINCFFSSPFRTSSYFPCFSPILPLRLPLSASLVSSIGTSLSCSCSVLLRRAPAIKLVCIYFPSS